MRKPRGERNSFLTPLVVEVMPSGRKFRLFLPFTMKWQGYDIRLPVGFETDFASIPRFARILIPKLGRYNKAAVVHDALYQLATLPEYLLCCGTGPSFTVARRVVTRKDADGIFLAGMVALGVAPWKRRLMYWAVRLGGWAAWRKR